MPAPIAKGIIIVASVLVAASIALYENPQVRNWVDNRRRKIAVALHSLGDEINPPQSSRNSQDNGNGGLSEDQRRRRREEIIRRNRSELIRKAREEGVAVDLDELAAVSRGTEEEKRPVAKSRGSSFDDLVTSEGKLREEQTTAAMSTAVEKSEEGLRHRGQGALGLATGSSFANPFADEAGVLFDQDEEDERAIKYEAEPRESRESTVTLQANTPAPQIAAPLVDLSDAPSQSEVEMQQHSQDLLIPSLAATEAAPSEASFQSFVEDREDNEEVRSTGTLTPTDASVVGNDDDIDIGMLSQSETMSEAGFSETGYSEIGVSTPGSWTDVGSDAGSDDEFAQHQ